jgi:hypothetical protein
MARYDIETFLGAVEAHLKANLSDALTAVTTEKGDGLTLEPVSSDGYFIQTLDERVTNYNPYIYIGATEAPEVTANGPAQSKTYRVSVVLVIANSGGDANLWKRMCRYQSAIESVFANAWDRIAKGPKVTFDSAINPVEPQYHMQQVGIQVRVTIA